MALAKLGLGFPVSCSANATTTVYANPATTTAYIRSLLLHNRSSTDVVSMSIHLVQNSTGAVGSVADSNRIARIALQPFDSYFLELAFPITLTATNDAIRAVNHNTTAGQDANILILGDKEA